MMPFLEIVTRTFGLRSQMLKENQASVRALKGSDHSQILLVDHQRAGVAAANAALAWHEPQCTYVWVLDDDDFCTYPGLVKDLKYLAWVHGQPPAFIVRMDHGPGLGVLPAMAHWCQPPMESGIGCSAIITRRDVWLQCRQAWASDRYAADFDFITAVWAAHGHGIVWHDVVASRCQRISRGEPEPPGRVRL